MKTDIPSAGPTAEGIGVGIGTMLFPTPFVLFHNALALSRGVAFNPDDIGVIDNPVTDS